MPINIYGTNDNFHPKYSHVIPGLISRMHKAKINNDPKLKSGVLAMHLGILCILMIALMVSVRK